jgi:phosphatidylglycerophosphatase A
MNMRERCIRVLATGGGLGLSPFAPGTAGTLPGLGIAVVLGMCGMDWVWQAAVAAVLAAVAIPICGAAERLYGTKDDRRIVADEYLTFPICVLGLPWMAHPWLLALAFVTNRAMDVIKPPPARQLQEVRGGAGIVLDDFFSTLYALALNHALWAAWCRWGLCAPP